MVIVLDSESDLREFESYSLPDNYIPRGLDPPEALTVRVVRNCVCPSEDQVKRFAKVESQDVLEVAS